ncbi:MAG: helix-turn-helix domain-containing protein [Pseudonocardiaceae bacterium]
MDAHEAGLIGLRVRQVRERRDKSLRVISDLAVMSTTTLWRIEHGEHSPTLKEIFALANALQISASELTRLPVPAPANGHTDSTMEAIGLALDSIDVDQPDGLVLPVAVLRDQVAQLHEHTRACRFVEVASTLPRLIRDVHTTLNTGSDHRELLGLAVGLHVHVTRMWLNQAGAPADLRLRVVFLARRLAQEHGAMTLLGSPRSVSRMRWPVVVERSGWRSRSWTTSPCPRPRRTP